MQARSDRHNVQIQAKIDALKKSREETRKMIEKAKRAKASGKEMKGGESLEELINRRDEETMKIKALKGRFTNSAENRLKLIARTEVSKTQTALIESRARSLGVNWYIWRTSEDGDRVRKSHRHMEGVLINWNDPPSPESLVGAKSFGKYQAGDVFNCRCYPEPIVNLDYVGFPAKVYVGGVIKTMTLAQFERITV